jgi:hypothetical protein
MLPIELTVGAPTLAQRHLGPSLALVASRKSRALVLTLISMLRVLLTLPYRPN